MCVYRNLNVLFFNRIGTFVIMIFQLSLGMDMTKFYLCEVEEEESSNDSDDTAVNHKAKTVV